MIEASDLDFRGDVGEDTVEAEAEAAVAAKDPASETLMNYIEEMVP